MADSKMRALVGVALGCDYLVGGIKGVGPKKVQEMLLANPDQNPETFVSSLASNPKSTIRDPNVYRCIVQSILYEPTTDSYMQEIPRTLYEYNKEFSSPSTGILENPCPMLECIGCNGDRHKFLSAEGLYKCSTCRACLCRFCVFDETAAKTECFMCATSFLEDADTLNEEDMRHALALIPGTPINVDTQYADVLEMYDLYVVEGDTTFLGLPVVWEMSRTRC
jgi:hypothetical protein